MSDIKALLAGAKLPERTIEVCLHADLAAQYEELDRQRAAAEEAPQDNRLTSKAPARQIAEQMADLRQDMLDSTVTFRLRALSRHRFQALVDRHPPRRGGDGAALPEDSMGINSATFFDDLIRASVVEPALDDDDWANLLGVQRDHDGTCTLNDPNADNPACACRDGALTSRQFDNLGQAAWGLNRRDVSIPFSPAASRLLQHSANGSKPPNG